MLTPVLCWLYASGHCHDEQCHKTWLMGFYQDVPTTAWFSDLCRGCLQLCDTRVPGHLTEQSLSCPVSEIGETPDRERVLVVSGFFLFHSRDTKALVVYALVLLEAYRQFFGLHDFCRQILNADFSLILHKHLIFFLILYKNIGIDFIL